MSYKDTAFEALCVLSWSDDARKAYFEALAEYQKAGSPGIPLGARNFRKTWAKLTPDEKREKLKIWYGSG